MSEEELKPSSDFLMSEFQEALSEKGQAFEGSTRFSDEEYLCEGGCKKLFVITDYWADRQIVKAVPKDESPETVEKFIYESQVLSSLEHPNILPAYDVGSDEGSPFILMKLMEGDNLEEFLAYDPPLSLKLKIFEKLCDAIVYCHSHGVVHLDLKPENIQVSPTFEVTVCDWGSAKRLTDLSESELAATPGYIAPEAFEGNLSPQSDIFALGAILYEILTLKPLFSGSSSTEIMKANKAGFVDLSLIKDSSLKAICKQLLMSDPGKRFKSVEDVLNRLDLYYQKFPIPEEKASLLRKCDLLVKRRPVAVGVFTVLLTMTSVISIIFAMVFNQQKNQAENLMNQYQEERDKRVSLSLTNSEMLHNQAWKSYKNCQFEEAMELLKLSVSSSGYDSRKYELEGLLKLLQFQLSEAQDSFSKAGIKDQYKAYFRLIPERKKLLEMSPKELAALIMEIRKVDSFYYHNFIGAIYSLEELGLSAKEEYLNLVTKLLSFQGRVKLQDGGNTLVVSGNAHSFPTYILRALRIKKLDFRNCHRMPSDIRVKEINDCMDLEELDLRKTPFSHLYLLKQNNIKKLFLPAKSFGRIDHLQAMPLEELYMVNTKVKSLKPLLLIHTLKKLTISQSMTKLDGYKELAAKVQILIEK